MKLTEDDNLEESFETAQQAITPQASIGGMGEVSFPDGDTLGSGDVPSVADIDDDEEEAKKDKTKKKLEMEALHLTFDSFLNELNINEGNFEGVADLVKALHFELDPKTAEEMKIELGKRQGELVVRTQIEGGNYSLKRFRKEIKYGSDNKNIDLGVFVPGTYTAAVSTLGDGPHAKAAKKIKWNQKKYDQWLEDVASNDGWKNASDMAQNANNEPGLIAWVKKNNRGEDAMQRIQWDIEAFAESVVIESKNSKEIKELEKLLKSIKSNTPADQGRKASIQDDIERLKNESVVTEAKNTIGLAFKEEQDYLDFKEFVAEQPRGAIRKNIGFDSKTKSWNVEMDVKVLDSIYGEGTPSDKKSGWYGGLPDDFESVIIESVVTEGIKKGATVSYQAFHASNHPSGSYRYEVKANVLSVSGKEAKITYKDQDGKTKTIEVEIEKLSEAFAESVVTEGKMPNKLINDDDIVFLKTSENSKGAHYNVYYKGYDIDFGGVGFGTEKQLNSYAKEYILSRQWANKLRWEDAKPLPESVVTEARNYKESPDGKHKVKATVCYIKPMSGKRECKAIYFKSKHDALGFKDNVKGFPKGAAVEAIKESNMKYTTLFEEFIKKTKSVSSQNEAVKVTPESDIKIDDYTSDNGEEIKAVEIVGAISSSETEDEFLDYFYDAYGQGAFTETDTSTLVKYFNDYLEEITAKETEEEEAEKEGGGEEEDPLADLDI